MSPRTARRLWHLRTLARIALRVALVVGVSLAGLVAIREFVPPQMLRDTSDVVGNYLQTLGTIYAVLQAFVVFVVWSQFNDARALVEREANDVSDLFRTTQGLPEPLRTRMRDQLGRYVEGVLVDEWPAMAAHDLATLDRQTVTLEAAFAELRAYEPTGDREVALYSHTHERFNELFDVRTLRLTAACTRVPFGLRALLVTGAGLVIGSMYLFAVESFAIHAIITGATAGAIAHVLYVVDDLDDCFSGDFVVPRQPFERTRRLFAQSAEGAGGAASAGGAG